MVIKKQRYIVLRQKLSLAPIYETTKRKMCCG